MKRYYKCDCCGKATDKVFNIPVNRLGTLERLFGRFKSYDVCDRCFYLMCDWVWRKIDERKS